jgi:ribosomal protein S17
MVAPATRARARLVSRAHEDEGKRHAGAGDTVTGHGDGVSIGNPRPVHCIACLPVAREKSFILRAVTRSRDVMLL